MHCSLCGKKKSYWELHLVKISDHPDAMKQMCCEDCLGWNVKEKYVKLPIKNPITGKKDFVIHRKE